MTRPHESIFVRDPNSSGINKSHILKYLILTKCPNFIEECLMSFTYMTKCPINKVYNWYLVQWPIVLMSHVQCRKCPGRNWQFVRWPCACPRLRSQSSGALVGTSWLDNYQNDPHINMNLLTVQYMSKKILGNKEKKSYKYRLLCFYIKSSWENTKLQMVKNMNWLEFLVLDPDGDSLAANVDFEHIYKVKISEEEQIWRTFKK